MKIWNSVLFHIFGRPPKWAKMGMPLVKAKTIFLVSLQFMLLKQIMAQILLQAQPLKM